MFGILLIRILSSFLRFVKGIVPESNEANSNVHSCAVRLVESSVAVYGYLQIVNGKLADRERRWLLVRPILQEYDAFTVELASHHAEFGKLAARHNFVEIAEACRREAAGITPACIQFISSTLVHFCYTAFGTAPPWPINESMF